MEALMILNALYLHNSFYKALVIDIQKDECAGMVFFIWDFIKPFEPQYAMFHGHDITTKINCIHIENNILIANTFI